MLHEFETNRRAPTAPKDTHNIRAISHGSVLFGILGASILAMITFLECIILLVFPYPRAPHRRCITPCYSKGVSNLEKHRGAHPLALELESRDERNRSSSDRRC